MLQYRRRVVLLLVLVYLTTEILGGFEYDFESSSSSSDDNDSDEDYEVKIDDFPFVVSIKASNPAGDQRLCSGSIIDKHWILTAKSCVSGFANVHVFNDAKPHHYTPDPIKTHLTVSHETNDIALIKLETPIPHFDADHNSIRLNVHSDLQTGLTVQSSKRLRNDVVVLDNCAVGYMSEMKKRREKALMTTVRKYLDNRYVCTFPNNLRSTCRNYLGGPLVYNHTLIGVASHGVGAKSHIRSDCSTPLLAYANVGFHIQWIRFVQSVYENVTNEIII